MDIQFFKGLFVNMSILLSASILMNLLYFQTLRNTVRRDLLMGVLGGIIGIFLLMNTVALTNWVVFDTRSILISVLALFFGPVAALTATPFIVAYRIYMGGPSALLGVIVTCVTMAFGLVWRSLALRQKRTMGSLTVGNLYLFGFLTHILMLLCMFLQPWERTLEVLRAITLPVLILFPLGTVLIGVVIKTRYREMETEKELREHEEQLRVMYNQAPIGIAILESNRIARANDRFTSITCEKPGDTARFLGEALIPQAEQPSDAESIQTFLSGSANSYQAEKPINMPDGRLMWAHLTLTRLGKQGPPMGRVLCHIEDVTERRRKDEALLNAYTVGAMTGVYNRAYLDRETARYEGLGYLPLSLILCDVDGLKLINDAFGNEEGDALLRGVARMLQAAARPRDLVVRYGGDEFLLLMPNTDARETSEICIRLREAMEAHTAGAGVGKGRTSLSFGFATRDKADQSLYDTMRTAENYLFTHKLLSKKSLHSAILTSIKATLYEKSFETEEHCERMARMSRRLGQELGLIGEQLDLLELGAYLHDIGKVRIDSSILKKPGKLTDAEWTEIKKHPEAGYRIALSVPELQNVAEIILRHHEKWDGSGYPDGLRGEEIPLLARIVAITDAYDAMTTDRGYRQVMTHEEAVAEIRRCAGSHFDSRVADVLIRNVLR